MSDSPMVNQLIFHKESSKFRVKNEDYTVSELVHDRTFQRMVKGTASPDEIDKWSKWIEKSNRNRQKARIAMSEIAGFEFADPVIPDVEEAWSKLHDATVGKKAAPRLRIVRKDTSLQWLYRSVAALLLISIVSVGSYIYTENHQLTQLEQITHEKRITTGEGERKTLKFSNGSKIVLNSNSALTYKIGLLSGRTIQVALEGEAYFVANSGALTEEPAFEVITPDGIIEDIGTKFLVTVAEGRSRVILQDGLVRVERKSEKKLDSEFRVRQGEMVEFNRDGILKKEIVNSTFYTSWATGFIQFNQTEISEFADYVEQRFDVQVQISDSGLSGIEMDGAVYFRSVEGLVRSVSDVIKIPVYQSEDRDTIYIGNYQQ